MKHNRLINVLGHNFPLYILGIFGNGNNNDRITVWEISTKGVFRLWSMQWECKNYSSSAAQVRTISAEEVSSWFCLLKHLVWLLQCVWVNHSSLPLHSTFLPKQLLISELPPYQYLMNKLDGRIHGVSDRPVNQRVARDLCEPKWI